MALSLEKCHLPASPWAIEAGVRCPRKRPLGGGLATATIDGLTFPLNYPFQIPPTSCDRESRTVV